MIIKINGEWEWDPTISAAGWQVSQVNYLSRVCPCTDNNAPVMRTTGMTEVREAEGRRESLLIRLETVKDETSPSRGKSEGATLW